LQSRRDLDVMLRDFLVWDLICLSTSVCFTAALANRGFVATPFQRLQFHKLYKLRFDNFLTFSHVGQWKNQSLFGSEWFWVYRIVFSPP
jgi:hypothetical protein